MELGSSRYVELVELLIHYDGAVRHALAAELASAGQHSSTGPSPQAPVHEGPPLPEGAVVVDLDTAVALANDDPAFAAIEHLK